MGKKNKPRWKDLNMYERIARRCKQRGGSDEWVEWLRQKAIKKQLKGLNNMCSNLNEALMEGYY